MSQQVITSSETYPAATTRCNATSTMRHPSMVTTGSSTCKISVAMITLPPSSDCPTDIWLRLRVRCKYVGKNHFPIDLDPIINCSAIIRTLRSLISRGCSQQTILACSTHNVQNALGVVTCVHARHLRKRVLANKADILDIHFGPNIDTIHHQYAWKSFLYTNFRKTYMDFSPYYRERVNINLKISQ